MLIDALHYVCGSAVFEVRCSAGEEYPVAYWTLIFLVDVGDRGERPVRGG